MIEFPVNGRGAVESTVPAWRAEISARVRAAKARRQAELEASSYAATGRSGSAAVQVALDLETEPLPEDPKDANPIVEAALRRLEQARQPVVPPVRPTPSPIRPNPAPAPRVEPLPKELTLPLSGSTFSTASRSESTSAPATAVSFTPAPVSAATTSATAVATATALSEETVEQLLLDEELSYLNETKYDRDSLTYDYAADMISGTSSTLDPDAQLDQLLHLGATDFDEAARVGQRIVSGAIDGFVVLLTTSPFVAACLWLQVDLRLPQVWATLAAIAIVVGFFYSVLSVGLGSRTVGMSFTGIRVMSLRTGKQPNVIEAALRVSGHVLSLAPLLLGYLWIVLGAERRAWHDILSNTSVVRDY